MHCLLHLLIFATLHLTLLPINTLGQPPSLEQKLEALRFASKAIRLAEPEADKLVEPEADKLVEPEADKLAEPEAIKLAEPEAIKLAEPEAKNFKEALTVSAIESKFLIKEWWTDEKGLNGDIFFDLDKKGYANLGFTKEEEAKLRAMTKRIMEAINLNKKAGRGKKIEAESDQCKLDVLLLYACYFNNIKVYLAKYKLNKSSQAVKIYKQLKVKKHHGKHQEEHEMNDEQMTELDADFKGNSSLKYIPTWLTKSLDKIRKEIGDVTEELEKKKEWFWEHVVRTFIWEPRPGKGKKTMKLALDLCKFDLDKKMEMDEGKSGHAGGGGGNCGNAVNTKEVANE